MKIKNLAALSKSKARREALEIAEAGLEAIDTGRVIRETVSLSDSTLIVDGEHTLLSGVGRILIAGIGKCAALAAAELETLLGDRITGGLVIAIGETPELKRVEIRRGTHPFPSKENMEASKALLALLSEPQKEDLIIFLVTGGGSTLLCLPEDGNYERESLIFGAFMNSGAPIEDINTVRKHMSLVRGGFLAKAMYPARVISLIFNDVPGTGDIGFIASGPTVKDATTIEDAERVLEKYKILAACNLSGCGLIETPKDDKYFERIKNIEVVSNRTALDAMKRAAEERGYNTEIADTKISGEAHDVGRSLAEKLAAAPTKSVMLYGGETTVTVHKSGKGGRNQELALGALLSVPEGGLILSLASDGRDNSDIGGAICDKIVQEAAAKLGLIPQSFLDENRSYDFWKGVGDYLDIGHTGSNVSDLIISLKTEYL